MSRYLNPYTDFGFKKLFGEEGSQELLVDFLNQLLPAHHQIKELRFKNTEQLPEIPLERKAIFDIYCTSLSGERFVVEMQKAKLRFFKDRSVFYVTFPIREQAEKGGWNFALTPVYFIAILDFEYDEAEEKRKFRRDVALRDQDGDLFFDKLHFKFLQMPLFKKKAEELETRFDKWIYFLSNLENFDQIPQILNEAIFRKAFEITEVANLSREQLTVYEQSLIDYWGITAALDTAREEGHEEGRAEGREEGRAEGLAEGMAQGIEKGKWEITRKMIAENLPIEWIIKCTGLTVEQIQSVKNADQT